MAPRRGPLGGGHGGRDGGWPLWGLSADGNIHEAFGDMPTNRLRSQAWRVLSLVPLSLLAGCVQRRGGDDFWMLDPKGIISATQDHYLTLDVLVMLLIIVPTAAFIVWAMRHYRKDGGRGHYDSRWDHSNALEAVIWGIPILTVGVLSYYSVKAIYAVNPYHPTVITRAERAPAAPAPLDVDVISTDWQWVFVYPQQHIATVDRLVIPKGVPVRFRLTSATVVNDFYIPQLVGMIDVMPGMRVRQSLVASSTGTYEGFSADYSGAGFSWMDFKTRAVSSKAFGAWVAKVQAAPRHLSYATFDTVARPTINVHDRVTYFSQVEPGLFRHVVAETRAGKTYPTPMAMTENMTGYLRLQARRDAKNRD